MHEVSIIQRALHVAAQHAEKEHCSSIRSIQLRVGALSGAVPEALQFAFEVLKKGTLAENARLDIERVQPVSYCQACQIEFSPEDVCYACPQCGKLSPALVRGNELELAKLEVA
jgi:hydrogenase nickel incorporation protein HypA/HybF